MWSITPHRNLMFMGMVAEVPLKTDTKLDSHGPSNVLTSQQREIPGFKP